jgi:hypothetical protein
MCEIFIPERLFDKIIINNISNNFLTLIQKNFEILEYKDFETQYCIWKSIKIKNPDQDILSLFNWEFWENYYIDYDFFKYSFETLWLQILKPESIWDNIWKISLQCNEIMQELSSIKLLTNSKKNEIHKKIEKIFFTISWILFLLYNLREKTIENLDELWNYTWEIEYEWQALLISESAQTKKIELSAQIIKFEEKSMLFYQAIEKIIL